MRGPCRRIALGPDEPPEVARQGSDPSAMRTAINLASVTDAASLDALHPQWSALVRHCANSSTFLTPEWLLSWGESYRPAADLRVITAHCGPALVGIAPFMITHERRLMMPVRCLRFIGDGSSETDHMDFVIRSDMENEVRTAMLDAMADMDWDLAVFSNVPGSSQTMTALRAWAQTHGYRQSEVTAPCPMRSLPETFEMLLASMPSRFRTSVRSTRRRLAAAYQVEFGLHDEPAEFEHALEALFANHESRWKARGQTGVFVNERRREFYRRLTPRLHALGSLRFFYLKLDGRIIAQEFCFAHDGVVYLLQEGFDFALARENVGNALRSHVFEYLIEHGYRAYDFLAGVSRHKLNWANASPVDVTMTLGRNSARGWVGFEGPRSLESLKDSLRPVRDRLRQAIVAAKSGPRADGPGS